MVKDMTCVSCPLGCSLKVTFEGDRLVSVTGNACKRGITYAETEISNPTRMLTSTVKVRGGLRPLVPVKSAIPIPKNKLMDSMKVINKVVLDAPVKLGDVVVRDILGTGIDIVTTSDNDLIAGG